MFKNFYCIFMIKYYLELYKKLLEYLVHCRSITKLLKINFFNCLNFIENECSLVK